MGGLRRYPLDGVEAMTQRWCIPAPPGVRLLANTCVAPGSKLLAKERAPVTCLKLDAPTDGFDFDTIIVHPADYAPMAALHRGPCPSS